MTTAPSINRTPEIRTPEINVAGSQAISSKITSGRMTAKSVLDTVPEFYHYEDTGCEVSRSCLNCPLPRCKYDDPIWFQRNRRLARDFKVWSAIQADQLSVEDAAERFSVTVRTIFRIMCRCRDAEMEMDSEELLAFAAD